MSSTVFPRKVHAKINQLLQKHPVLLISGAFGTGKTTFLREHFSEYEYLSLKNKTHKSLLEQDPYRFFNLYAGKTIFDDVEEVPGFPELVTTYSLSIYQSGNYILVSNIIQESDSPYVKSCRFYPLDLQEMKNARKFKLTLEGNCIASALPGEISYKKYLDTVFAGPFASLTPDPGSKIAVFAHQSLRGTNPSAAEPERNCQKPGRIAAFGSKLAEYF